MKMCKSMYYCMNAVNIVWIGKNLFYVCSQFDSNITQVFNSRLCFIKTEEWEEQCMTLTVELCPHHVFS